MLDKNKLIDIINNHSVDVLGHPRKASVLLLLTKIQGEWHIIFEVRAHTIRQPGETSFPGGGIEEGESKEEAAIRETVEELGVAAENIEIIGELGYTASDQHVVYCFVAILKNTRLEDLKPNPDEVSDVFSLPLSYFFKNKPERYKIPLKTDHDADFPFDLIKDGPEYPFYALNRLVEFYNLPEKYKQYSLWGFTAGFVSNFIEIIDEGLEL